jgi:molybdenum cofactor cytidylyltransferase
MGRPKLLLPWDKTSVLGHLLNTWQVLGAAQIAVVVARGDNVLPGELDRLGLTGVGPISNPAPERGMFSSIQCAASWPGWSSGLTHWLISLGDQPHLRSATLRQLLEFAAANPGRICQPSRHGRARHPVLLPQPAFLQLAESAGPTLKDFLNSRAGECACCEIDDPGLDLDMDGPADYEKLRRKAIG